MSFKFKSPDSVLQATAVKAKSRRLAANLTRRTLSAKSGVSEASIKRFETTGEINFHSLLKIAFSLDCMDEFESLFNEKELQSVRDLKTRPKQRGRL